MSKIKDQARALAKLNRLTNYLSVAQIFLNDNFFLEKKLSKRNIKKRLLGHWGTCPGINFTQGQVNRLVVENSDQDFLFVIGPGHGFPAYQANILVDGSYSKIMPKKIPYTKTGFEEIIKNFSTPYGYPSHLNPEAPGVILEGGELGYSLAASAGSVIGHKDLVTVCLVGDGEAESGTLAASWNYNKFISPKEDGAVLPVLHLNGYKISGPSIFGRMNDSAIKKYFEALGYKPFFIDASAKKDVQVRGIEIFDKALAQIKKVQKKARTGADTVAPKWPIIILKTPKGMGAPDMVGDKKIVGNHFSHQVVFDDLGDAVELEMLEDWMSSYDVSELVSFEGKEKIAVLDDDIKSVLPEVDRALGVSPVAHGGDVVKDLVLPEVDEFFVEQKRAEKGKENSMHLAGKYLRDVFAKNENIRLFSPDETYSNKLESVFEVTKRAWQLPIKGHDLDMAREGKVIEILSEHLLFGMMMGYSLTGRHGIFVTYEAFGQIVASMADQYVKFLSASKRAEFRGGVPSMNVILSSLLERQDHNGFSHQNPSFISANLDRGSDLVNVYFPADKNLMLHATKEVLESKNRLNIVVAGKKMTRTWLDAKEARDLAKNGVGRFDFLSDKKASVVVATCGDYITEEAVVGVRMFKKRFPKVKIDFVNFFRLDVLEDKKDEILKEYFGGKKRIIFNYHGYPSTIKKMLFDYGIAESVEINGYEEEGSTTSPFDMFARNGTSRMHLVKDIAKAAFDLKKISKKDFESVVKEMNDLLEMERSFIIENKVDPESISNWEV